MSFQPQTDHRSEPIRTLVAIGDSITAGACASSQDKCWVSLVARVLEEAQHRQIETINSGIGGNVITPECPNYEVSGQPAGLERVETGIVTHHPDIVLIAYGLNDSRGGTTPEVFERALHEMIDRIRAGGDPVLVLLNLYYMHEAFYDFEPWHHSNYAVTDVFNGVIARIAAATGALLADIYSAQCGVDWSVSADHCHPNDLGHRLIANEVFKTIARNCSFVAPQGR